MLDGALSFESLDRGGVDEELAVGEHSLMDTLGIFLALLLLN